MASSNQKETHIDNVNNDPHIFDKKKEDFYIKRASVEEETRLRINDKHAEAQVKKDEAKAKRDARIAKLNTILTDEDEAYDEFRKASMMGFLGVLLLSMAIVIIYTYSVAYNVQPFAEWTAERWVLLFTNMFSQTNKDALIFFAELSIGLPIVFYWILPLVFLMISKMFEGRDIGFLGAIFHNYGHVHSIGKELVMNRIEKRIGKKGSGERKHFISMGYWYFFTTFFRALFQKTDMKVTKVQPKEYEDEVTMAIDSVIEIRKLSVERRDLAVQGRDASGKFEDVEAQRDRPKIKKKEGNKYYYSLPIGFEFNALKESLPIFSQELRRQSKGVNIDLSDDGSFIIFDVFTVINLNDKVLNWYEYTTAFNQMKPLEIPIGLSPNGNVVYLPSINEVPHVIIAGGTGSGKSVSVAVVELGIIYANSPEELGLCIIDPHMSGTSMALRDSVYNYFKGKLFSENEEIVAVIDALVHELDYRRNVIGELEEISEFTAFNQRASMLGKKKMRRIVTFFEEFSGTYVGLDRADKERFKRGLERIGKEGRKYGIHIIAVEQNPVAEAFPTALKNQMGTKICMRVDSPVMSTVVLGGLIDGASADTIKILGMALVKTLKYSGMMKFFAIPESDEKLGLTGQFQNLKAFIQAVEKKHGIGTTIPEEHIADLTHIAEDDLVKLGMSTRNDTEKEMTQEDRESLVSLSESANEWFLHANGRVPKGDICMIILAKNNQNGITQLSWNKEFAEVSGLAKNKFATKQDFLVSMNVLKRVLIDRFYRNVLVNDIESSVAILEQYYTNLEQQPNEQSQ